MISWIKLPQSCIQGLYFPLAVAVYVDIERPCSIFYLQGLIIWCCALRIRSRASIQGPL